MTSELKGTKTEANLLAAFAGESQARNKYTYFASQAKKEGYVQIANIFEETAANENYEWAKMYANMAKDAREEGFDHIANLMEGVAKIEKEHEERYRKLAANIQSGEVFKRDNVVLWQCTNCGHTTLSKEAPQVCPICAHPQAYFQIKAENY